MIGFNKPYMTGKETEYLKDSVLPFLHSFILTFKSIEKNCIYLKYDRKSI